MSAAKVPFPQLSQQMSRKKHFKIFLQKKRQSTDMIYLSEFSLQIW